LVWCIRRTMPNRTRQKEDSQPSSLTMVQQPLNLASEPGMIFFHFQIVAVYRTVKCIMDFILCWYSLCTASHLTPKFLSSSAACKTLRCTNLCFSLCGCTASLAFVIFDVVRPRNGKELRTPRFVIVVPSVSDSVRKQR
jgi:hypothetical protein